MRLLEKSTAFRFIQAITSISITARSPDTQSVERVTPGTRVFVDPHHCANSRTLPGYRVPPGIRGTRVPRVPDQ
eukprot:3670295-Rhodomonas_salina.1